MMFVTKSSEVICHQDLKSWDLGYKVLLKYFITSVAPHPFMGWTSLFKTVCIFQIANSLWLIPKVRRLRKAFKSDFWKNLGFYPNGGGGGLPVPSFDPIFPRVLLLQYGGGSLVPTKNHIKNHQKSRKKSPITKKMGFVHEKITCLE